MQADSLPAEPTREAQEYWSGWPIPSLVDLPGPGIKLGSPALQADSLPAELQEKPTDTEALPSLLGFPGDSVVKNPPAKAGDPDLIPG